MEGAAYDLSDALRGLPVPGERFAGGKYAVDAVIGVGGMGAVLGATHLQLRQRVAVKFLLPSAMRSPGAVERFLREARASVGLRGEHIVRVLDVDTLETGTPYIVMEHLIGADLGELLDLCGALPAAEATEYLLQACEGVAEAHAAGLVHRDLKPANLFVTDGPDGAPLVKVLDFGISKALQPDLMAVGRADLTSTRTVMGSPLYMSPEQIKTPRALDVRTDVWALGVILYEIMTGHPPFDAESIPALCVQIANEPPRALREHLPDVPEALEAVVLRCLEKDLERRFANVADLALALAPFASGDGRSAAERIARRLSRAGTTGDKPARAENVAMPAAAVSRRVTPDVLAQARQVARARSGSQPIASEGRTPTLPASAATPASIAPATRVSGVMLAETLAAPGSGPLPASAAPPPPVVDAAAPHGPTGRWRAIVLASVGAVLLALAIVVWLQAAPSPSSGAMPHRPSTPERDDAVRPRVAPIHEQRAPAVPARAAADEPAPPPEPAKVVKRPARPAPAANPADEQLEIRLAR